jgi:cell filamentation protein
VGRRASHKPNGKGGNWFCYPEHNQREANRLFDWLRNSDYLTNREDQEFARGAAHLLSELNAIHPIREGNGRTQLAFLKLLTLNAGRTFDDEALDPTRTIAAMVVSFSGDLDPLADLVADIIA